MKLVHIGNDSGSYEAIVLIDDDTAPEDFLVGKDPTEEIVSVTEIDDYDLPGSLPVGYRMVKAGLLSNFWPSPSSVVPYGGQPRTVNSSGGKTMKTESPCSRCRLVTERCPKCFVCLTCPLVWGEPHDPKACQYRTKEPDNHITQDA